MTEFEACYTRLVRPLLGYARLLSGDEADALDLVQETFVAWLAKPRRVDVLDVDSYLFRALRNRWLNVVRDRQRRRRETAASSQPTVFTPDADSPIVAAELQAAMARLPDDQREAVFMKVWGGLTFEQIGQAADVPGKTAASRYAAALARLRELLA